MKIKAKKMSKLEVCFENLKKYGTVLEMFATDHQGNYPESLNELIPDYLKKFPQCPTSSGKYLYLKDPENPNWFSVACGASHAGERPRFSSDKGYQYKG